MKKASKTTLGRASDQQIRAVALFFFLAFLDEPLAIKAALKTIDQMERRLNRKDPTATVVSPESLLVYLTHQNWRRFRGARGEIQSFRSAETNWQIPATLDLGSWRQLHKEGNADEILAVVWSEVLGIPADQIAQGLGLTIGTVRYRIGNGLRQLGPMILPGRVYG